MNLREKIPKAAKIIRSLCYSYQRESVLGWRSSGEKGGNSLKHSSGKNRLSLKFDFLWEMKRDGGLTDASTFW
jgi:hypothetical protein